MDWKQAEEKAMQIFPFAKGTKASGSTWGDGDLVSLDLSLEVKHQKKVSLDAWWKQARIQASRYNKVPCLVIVRPPVDLGLYRSLEEEFLAVIPLKHLNYLYEKIKRLESNGED